MKYIILIAFSIFIFNTTKAQLTKGNWMLGGNLSFASTKYNSANYTPPTYTNVLVDINPNVAYFVANNFNVGIKTTFSKTYRVNSSSYTSFRLGPSCRYYFLENENRIINDALVNCPFDFESNPTNFDKLVKLQHYGYPTRLLDLTNNALVALYFAVSSGADTDGEIIIFNENNDLAYGIS